MEDNLKRLINYYINLYDKDPFVNKKVLIKLLNFNLEKNETYNYKLIKGNNLVLSEVNRCDLYCENIEGFKRDYSLNKIIKSLRLIKEKNEKYKNTFIHVPFYFDISNLEHINNIEILFKDINNSSNFFVVSKYKDIDQYYYIYLLSKKYKLKVGIEIKNREDVYKLKVYEYFNFISINIDSVYYNKEEELSGAEILEDIRLIRDELKLSNKKVAINVSKAKDLWLLKRLKSSGFKTYKKHY